jgi:phenylpyruvate tautomerase PptA (4-oxalocrotonate tautomerase family)
MENITKMSMSVSSKYESATVAVIINDVPPFNWGVDITLCGAAPVRILERETLEGLQKALQLAIDRLF